MHASATQHLLSHLLPSAKSPAPRILDVGSSSGYLTYIFAELVGDRGFVVGLEHIQELRDLGERNMRKSNEGKQLLDSGLEEAARQGEEAGGTGWDVIHVGASAKQVHPQLLSQLKSPGWHLSYESSMFIPVDDDATGYMQSVWRIEKNHQGEVSKEKLFGVRYVPLTDAPVKN